MESRAPFRVGAIVAGLLTLFHAVSRIADEGVPARILGWTRGIEVALLDADYRIRPSLRSPPRIDPKLVLVGLDEGSAGRAATFAYENEFFIAVFEKIAEAKPRLIVLDILVHYPYLTTALRARLDSETSALASTHDLSGAGASRMRRLGESIDLEARLARAIAGTPTLLPVSCNPALLRAPEARPGEDAWFLSRAQAVERPAELGLDVFRLNEFFAPLQSLGEHAEIAHSCELPESDGVLRRDLTVLETPRAGKEWLLPSIEIVAARHALGLPADALHVERDQLVLGDRTVPLDRQGRTYYDYFGAAGSFRGRGTPGHPSEYSAADVLDDKVPAHNFTDRVVFLGSTRASQRDAKITPFSGIDGSRIPGIEKIATQVDGILRNRLPRRPRVSDFAYLLTMLVGVGGAALATRVRPSVVLGVSVLSAAALLFTGFALFAFADLWFETGFPAIAAVLPAVVTAAARYREEEEKREFLTRAFGMYVPPQIVKEMMARGRVQTEGAARELTILFADLRNFTSSAGAMPPEETVQLLNEHFHAMADVIARHGGTLDKFIGDAVMAFWNAPLDDADHARHACAAALEMLAVLDQMNERRLAASRPPQDMGIGLATGRVIVGSMGASERHLNYTAVGDAVNVSSRLEGLTKTSDYRILVGEETRRAAGDSIGFVELGVVPVKGKENGVTVFAIASSHRAPLKKKAAESGPA